MKNSKLRRAHYNQISLSSTIQIGGIIISYILYILSIENKLMKIEIRMYRRNFVLAKSSFVKICSILCQLWYMPI